MNQMADSRIPRARKGPAWQWMLATLLTVGLALALGAGARRFMTSPVHRGLPRWGGLSDADKTLIGHSLQRYYDGLQKGSFRRAAEVVYPPAPPDMVPRAVAWMADGLLDPTAVSHFDACAQNLQSLGWAIEQWSADADDTGQLPDSLKSLVPTYFKVLPSCPDAPGAAYRYDHSARTGRFTLTCEGTHHVLAGALADSPQYTSTFALVKARQSPENLHPRLTAWHLQEIAPDGQQAVATVQEQWQFAGRASTAISHFELTPAGPEWHLVTPAGPTGPVRATQVLAGKGLGEAFLVALAVTPGQFARASASRDNLTACCYNLQRVGAALDAWSSDHDGAYPQHLQDLVPKYIADLPRCPVDNGAYAAGYQPHGDDYVLTCPGDRHAGCNVPDGYPRIDTENGITLAPGTQARAASVP